MLKREKLLKSDIYWTEIIQNQVYSNLVRYMEENQISQREIADKLGVSRSYISQVLNGENLNFRINTLIKICLAIDKVPNIKFENIDKFIQNDKKKKLEHEGTQHIYNYGLEWLTGSKLFTAKQNARLKKNPKEKIVHLYQANKEEVQYQIN